MPPKKEEDGEEEANDGVEKLFKPIDISRVQKFLYVTTTLLLLIALGVIVLAALTSDSRTRETSIISAVVMILACCLAFYSGSYKDRGGLQLVFLLYVWQVRVGQGPLCCFFWGGSKLVFFFQTLSRCFVFSFAAASSENFFLCGPSARVAVRMRRRHRKGCAWLCVG
jgi:hypothetical protein